MAPTYLLFAIALFNGRTLDGWVHEGTHASFAAVEKEIVCSGQANYPNWLRTDREFENFRLRFEYNLAQWAETSVIIRAPRWGRPSQSGIALFLAHDFHKHPSKHVTGAIAGVEPPREFLTPSFDVWHKAEILADGPNLKIYIDGTLQQDVNVDMHPVLRYRLKRGYIGIQDLGHRTRFRNIELEDLGNRLEYVRLFNGTDLTGWQLRDHGNWSIREGTIHAYNGHGIYYASPTFGDFELTLAARSHNRVNAGVFLHGQPEGLNRGFEIQINSPPDAVYPTGSIYNLVRADLQEDLEDQWFLLHIRVEAATVRIWVNGREVASTTNLPEANRAPGRIGLQLHHDSASIEYRDIRVRPLGAIKQ